DHILAKVDSASMSVSLEVRVPFLDYRVVELAGRMPASFKVKDGVGKWLLKRLARRWLPIDLIELNKIGFDPPLSAWIFDSKIDSSLKDLSNPGAGFRGLMDGKLVDRWIRHLQEHSYWHVPQRATLWAVYQFERWFQMGAVM